MTSLGNYASASVLKCNNMICDTLTAVNLNPINTLTQVYGKFDLSQNTNATGNLSTIGNWQPTSILKNVSVLPYAGSTGNARFFVTQVGLYEITTCLQVDGGAGDILTIESRVVLYPSGIVAGGSLFTYGQAGDTRMVTQSNVVQLEITDPTTQYVEVEGRANTGVGTHNYDTTYTHVFIRKIV